MPNKRRMGDRKDGVLLRDLDSMHFICPLLYPNRCDNEAFIAERIDLTNLNAYLEKHNAERPEDPYNLFQVIVTAVMKVITLRPKMNRFIANKNTYQRNEVSGSFVIKKEFSDGAAEALAFLHTKPEDTIDTIHAEIRRQITDCRERNRTDGSTDSMDMFNRMPRWLSKLIIRFVCFLDRHGWVPASLIETDPYYSSVVFTNLGSIRLRSGYHHLTNWGTSSLFCIIGEKKWTPLYDQNGLVEMRETVDLGLTVDERIADGYYYSKSIRLFKYLLEHPELLEQPLSAEVDY